MAESNEWFKIDHIEPFGGVYYDGWTAPGPGPKSNKCRHGIGRQVCDDNSVYFGMWTEDRKTGYGYMKYKHDNVYIG